MNEDKKQKREALMGKFVLTAQKIGDQIYLRTLRDSFATIMPLFILAGIAILINSVVLDSTGWFKILLAQKQWQLGKIGEILLLTQH